MGGIKQSTWDLINKLKMHQKICIVATLLAGICQAFPDHIPGHPHAHPHPVHHQAVHHAGAHHQTVHHSPVHHQAAFHHPAVHHAGAHHQTVHHAGGHAVHHQGVHHTPVHHQAVHHQAVHHQAVHHSPAQVPEQSYQPTEDVVDIAVGNPDFSTLVKIVSDLGLVETLKSAEAVTILAPTDAAFAKLPAGTLESLTPEQAKEIILRHVIPAKVSAGDITTGPVETIGGEVINLVKHSNNGIQINGPTTKTHVTLANIFATNGVIHVIDSVIL